MGYAREVVEALMEQSKETITTVDEAMEVMYDPMRHNFCSGFDITDNMISMFRQQGQNCIICLCPQADHDPEEIVRRATLRE